MKDKYSVFGPKPRTPSCMQRSYLLSIDFKVTSLTDWAAQLKVNPLYAILSGFEFGDTPGVGTFYDFLNRLWNLDDNHLSSHIHSLKVKAKKPKTKGIKAESVEKIKVDQLLPELENTSFDIKEQPYGSLFALYVKEFLNQSVTYYEYFGRVNSTSFIDLNGKGGIKLPYKNDFTIGKDGVPVCKEGRRMNHDGSEPSKHRRKYRCPLASRKYGCSCEHLCSDSK